MTEDDWPARFETARLELRVLEDADAPAYLARLLESHDFLVRWLGGPVVHIATCDEASAHLARLRGRYADRALLPLGLFTRADGRFIGNMAIVRPDWAARRFELGYWLADDARGHGYATEAASRLVAHMQTRLGARRIEIRTAPDNRASRAVAERLGFAFEGIVPRRDVEGEQDAVYALDPATCG